MIVGYFGIPGCGKTTLLTKFGIQELKKIKKGKSKYKAVYTNFYCEGCYRISYSDLENYKLYDCLILLDELALDADNRSFKSFPVGIRDFMTLHRHVGVDIIYATQSYEMVDAKIQRLTQELWYMSKTVIPFFNRFTHAKRIYRKIAITEHTSELVVGYRFCNLAESFFTSNFKCVYRPFYYKYFDSYEEGVLRERFLLPERAWSESERYTLNVKYEAIKDFVNSGVSFLQRFMSSSKDAAVSDESAVEQPDLSIEEFFAEEPKREA